MAAEKNTFEMLVEKVRGTFDSGRTRPVEFRKTQLRSLLKMYKDNTHLLIEALKIDLHRSDQECLLLEIDLMVNDVVNILDNINDWVKPVRPPKSFAYILDNAYIFKEPYGVVLVLGAWNYPFQLSLIPLAAAVAAGNCVVLKPSEIASASGKLMAELIPKYLDAESYHVVLGGPETATALLNERFDFIFFTGSTRVGQIVHEAASKYLTPTLLELGGKSPVYVDETVDIEVAARRILWGKWINAGQTCIAPDYVLCSKSVQDSFVSKAHKILDEWYSGKDDKASPDFCRIINDRNYHRLTKFLTDGKVSYGGNADATERYLQMTILTDVKPGSPVTREEIFGPILPVINVTDVENAVALINAGEKPLSLYVFSNKTKDVEYILKNTSSGGTCVNDTVMHFGCETLPFGGIGNSGMGAYHGKYGFDAFTHEKSCLYKDLGALGEKLSSGRYPPYSRSKTEFIRMLMKKRTGIKIPFLSHIIVFAAGVAVSFVVRAICDKYKQT